ncbi:MAG: hypothetical protein HW404_1687 [Anaerolineales bacterium]|nr:hypothetical protein [Anaerolineales bacterium]
MTTSTPGLLRLSRCVRLFALAGLLTGACARQSSIAATTESGVSGPLASATPLLPLSPTVQPTPSARVLTEAGCCTRHWWSADASKVLYIDDPPGDSPLGIYAAPTVGGEVSLVSTSVSAFRLPADADNVRLSPGGTAAAWTVGSSLPVNVDRRQRSLWVVGGPTELRRRLAILTGGDLVGWAEDGEAVIATGRIEADDAPGIWRIPIEGSPPTQLAEAERPRAARLSPTARWLAYYLAFETEPARNGLWIVGTSGEAARQVPSFGSYRWGPDERLFFIPFVPEDRPLTLAAFDPATGTTEVVREAEAFPGGIAANDWSVSPDGRWAVYRSATDAALWIVPMRVE